MDGIQPKSKVAKRGRREDKDHVGTSPFGGDNS